MHGVLRHYTLDAKNVNEVIRRVREGGVPIIKAISGFVSYAILDAGHGHLVTYSVYESKTGTEESTRKAAAWVKENIASMLPTLHACWRATSGCARSRSRRSTV